MPVERRRRRPDGGCSLTDGLVVELRLGTESAGRVLQKALALDGSLYPRPRTAKELASPKLQYRRAPLFRVLDLERPVPSVRVVVGEVIVTVDDDDVVRFVYVVQQVWRREDGGAWEAADPAADAQDLLAVLAKQPAWERDPVVGSRSRVATVASKELAAVSRGAVARFREERYAVEARLGGHLRRVKGEDLQDVLGNLVELQLMASRGRDVARASVREGMQQWLNEQAMYHAQRRLLDPTLPERPGAGKAMADPAFPTYDAGVRQCVNLEKQLAEEVEALRGLLATGTTIAAARDASAQENFNLVAAVSAIAIGLPALVLALYSASAFLPLQGPLGLGDYQLLLPLFIAGLLAAGVAAALPASSHPRRRFGTAMAGVIILILLLGTAGHYASRHLPSPARKPATHSQPTG